MIHFMLLQPRHRTPLPTQGALGEIRNVTLAANRAGVFLGVTTERGPYVVHGRSVDERLEWGAPWVPPVPPPREGTEHWATWDEYQGACENLAITVDALDPMRIAINLLEYQGGSFGIYVGRWNQAFQYLPHPFDADLPFGQPLILRGAELFTVESDRAFRHYRLADTSAPFVELGFDEDSELEIHHAGLDDSAETLVLGAGNELLVLERAGVGDFRLTKRVPTSEVISQLAVTRDGRGIVLVYREGRYQLLTYGRDGQESVELEIPFADLDDGASQPPYYSDMPRVVWTDGARAAFETTPGFVVVDLVSGSQLRLDAPYPAGSAGGQYHERALAIHGDHAVVASRDGVALYFLGGA